MTNIHIYSTPVDMGAASAAMAGRILRETLETKSQAVLILATGTSQFEMLNHLLLEPGIDWSRITIFHLDEYVGLPKIHPASFRKYLLDRFISHIPTGTFIEVEGDQPDPYSECLRLGSLISSKPVDLAMIGIGENGHIAFNDPPADFETDQPYLLVNLDRDCRLQQVGEGWFKSIDEVPEMAITMSVRQIMKSRHILCTVPDERKAIAVHTAVDGEITSNCPASILRQHTNYHLFLDRASASLLSNHEGR